VSACCHRHACTQYYCCHREQRDTVNSISLDTSGVTNCAFCLLYTNRKDGYRQRNVRQFLYILASPGYAPGTIAVNVTWMAIQYLSNASQHVPIYLQPFPSNSSRKFKSLPFLHIFAHFGIPGHGRRNRGVRWGQCPPTFGTSGVQGYRGGGPMKMIFASTADSLYSVGLLYK